MKKSSSSPGSLSKIVRCVAAESVRVFGCSNIMPEATQFKVTDLPEWPASPTQLRLLVVCGNFTKFIGDLDVPMWDYLLTGRGAGHWDHIVFVPGPYDYGGQTLATGDEYVDILARLDPKLTVLSPHSGNAFRGVFFTGPRLRVVGAPCWPGDDDYADYYREVGLYEEQADDETPEEAVHDCHLVTHATLKRRLARDVASMMTELRQADASRQTERRIVVSHGCPFEQCMADRSALLSLNVTLGRRDCYDFFDRAVDYWLYGARGDRSCERVGRIICRQGSYLSNKCSFQDREGFILWRPFDPDQKRPRRGKLYGEDA